MEKILGEGSGELTPVSIGSEFEYQNQQSDVEDWNVSFKTGASGIDLSEDVSYVDIDRGKSKKQFDVILRNDSGF